MSSFTHGVLQALPPSWRHRVVEIKNALWGGFRQYHYSQFGEDIVLQLLLKEKNGFYVDVGANHPTRYSNTYLLYKRGWRGINIEPNQDAVRLFLRKRARDTTLCVGVGAQEATRTYYRFSDPAYNTFSKEAADALAHKKWLAQLPSQKISVMPLANILQQHVAAGTHIDYLNVDAEGHDMEVLESNDWSRHSPRVISVEASDFDPAHPEANNVYQYLIEHGYKLSSFVLPTLIFIRKENSTR